MREPDIVEEAAALKAREEASGGPQAIIDTLVRGVTRQRHALWIVAVGLVLDLCLSIAVGVAYVRIAHNTATVHNTCISTNEARAQARSIWINVLALAPPKGPQAKVQTSKILKLVDETYRPRNCP